MSLSLSLLNSHTLETELSSRTRGMEHLTSNVTELSGRMYVSMFSTRAFLCHHIYSLFYFPFHCFLYFYFLWFNFSPVLFVVKKYHYNWNNLSMQELKSIRRMKRYRKKCKILLSIILDSVFSVQLFGLLWTIQQTTKDHWVMRERLCWNKCEYNLKITSFA